MLLPDSRFSFRLILTFYFLLAFAYSILMPPWEAPDETAHYLVVWHWVQDGRLPTPADTYEAVQPPAYYWFASQFLQALKRIDPELIRPSRPH